MTTFTRRSLIAGAAAGAALTVVGCTGSGAGNDAPPRVDPKSNGVFTRTPDANVTVPDADGAIGVSKALLSAATAVVVAPAPGAAAQPAASASPSPSRTATRTPAASASPSAAPGGDDKAKLAASVAKALGVPMFYDSPTLAAELDRLQTRTVISYGPDAHGRERVEGPASADNLPQLPGLPRKPDANAQLVLTDGEPEPATAATLAAAGITPLVLHSGHPGETKTSVEKVKADTKPIVAVGTAFGSVAAFDAKLDVARTAAELPGGGVTPFPGRRMIALYGHPGTAALGMMGEQPPAQAVGRVKKYVDEYQALLKDDTIIGAFEIITTVASGFPGKDGTYSFKTPQEQILPWIEEAERSGLYCVLDLQPGRTDFLTQAKLYADLLKRPWVGLALDPEWRLKPNQKHLQQIGQVGVDEINTVGAWLADFVKENKLPPKVLTLHQFQSRMIVGRDRLDTSRDEIQYLVHADGQGTQPMKQDTWGVLKKGLPANVYLGWKNFVDEDKPMLTPKQTVDQVHPTPYFVSYQ